MKYPTFFYSFFQACTTLLLTVIVAGCANNPTTQVRQFDFGPLSTTNLPHDSQNKLQVSLAEMTIPQALESNAMLYRLQYDNAQQLKTYALHHWSMPPAQLLAQRLKADFAANGNDIVASSDGAAKLPVLRIELDEFSQIFTSDSQSHAQISLRATVIKANRLLAQRSFQQKVAAATADAPGGARAMQEAADASIAELQTWMMSLPLK